jgi:hypothetical protein
MPDRRFVFTVIMETAGAFRHRRRNHQESTMKREHFPYKLAAIYPDERSADAAMDAIDAAVTADIRVTELGPYSGDVDRAIEADTGAVRDAVTRDAAAGGAAGSAVGAATAGAAAAITPALFISAPVVAPLIILGYGAVIGATAGAIHGLRLRDNLFSDMVKDALMAGYYVVVLHAADETARRQADSVIEATLPEQTTAN